MRYQIYFKGDKCLASSKGDVCILDMYKAMPVSTSCPVSSGGYITLNNGDTLHINEQYGGLDPGGNGYIEYYGIGLSLESGNAFIAWLTIPSSTTWPQTQQTGYNCFYDLNNKEYLEGNIIRIYALPDDDYETLQYYGESMSCYWNEANCMANLNYLGTIVLTDDEWVFTNETRYAGTTLTLDSGEEIFVSGPTAPDGFGIFYTRSSGNQAIAYYHRVNDDLIAESSNFWLSGPNGLPRDGYYMNIYDLGEDSYDDDIWGGEEPWNMNFHDEDEISSHVPLLCVLEYNENDGAWYITEDYSND